MWLAAVHNVCQPCFSCSKVAGIFIGDGRTAPTATRPTPAPALTSPSYSVNIAHAVFENGLASGKLLKGGTFVLFVVRLYWPLC